MQNRRIVYTCAVYVSMLSYIYVRCGLSRFSEHKPVGSVSFPPWGFSIMIPNSPKNEYDPASVKQLLAVAETYLFHADRLIYSYGSKTFLSGYAIYDEDYDGRGNIDCSTFLLLVLAGIPYEASPYTTGTVDGLKPASASWVQSELMDFTTLPKTYVDIAERIGRPYLACPKVWTWRKPPPSGSVPKRWARRSERAVPRAVPRPSHDTIQSSATVILIRRFCSQEISCFIDPQSFSQTAAMRKHRSFMWAS